MLGDKVSNFYGKYNISPKIPFLMAQIAGICVSDRKLAMFLLENLPYIRVEH